MHRPRAVTCFLERSEQMKSRCQEPEANDRGPKAEECLLDLRQTIEATPQAAKAVQPGESPLHEPTRDSQAAAVLGAALRQDRCDPHPTQQRPQRFGVVAAITLQALRLPPL